MARTERAAVTHVGDVGVSPHHLHTILPVLAKWKIKNRPRCCNTESGSKGQYTYHSLLPFYCNGKIQKLQ